MYGTGLFLSEGYVQDCLQLVKSDLPPGIGREGWHDVSYCSVSSRGNEDLRDKAMTQEGGGSKTMSGKRGMEVRKSAQQGL